MSCLDLAHPGARLSNAMTVRSGVTVEGNTAEEAAEIQEDILHKASLLQKFNLDEDPGDPAGKEEGEYFIVVKAELLRLQDWEAELDEETLGKLLDVPEEACCLADLPEDLAFINDRDFPQLCVQVKAFLDAIEEPEALEADSG
ncbi:unnamed protein product [Effrenium voratum]|nr:unnamed protein product [Effrenium voratum]